MKKKSPKRKKTESTCTAVMKDVLPGSRARVTTSPITTVKTDSLQSSPSASERRA